MRRVCRLIRGPRQARKSGGAGGRMDRQLDRKVTKVTPHPPLLTLPRDLPTLRAPGATSRTGGRFCGAGTRSWAAGPRPRASRAVSAAGSGEGIGAMGRICQFGPWRDNLGKTVFARDGRNRIWRGVERGRRFFCFARSHEATKIHPAFVMPDLIRHPFQRRRMDLGSRRTSHVPRSRMTMEGEAGPVPRPDRASRDWPSRSTRSSTFAASS